MAKTIILKCLDCGKEEKFSAETVNELLKKTVNSGWDHGTPEDGDTCPKCIVYYR